MATVCTELPDGTMAVPAARRFTTAVLRSWTAPVQVVEIAELVVSELVSNAVEHADGPVGLEIESIDGLLQLRVSDQAPALPRVMHPTPAEGRHRGLLIVEALTSKWGTQATPTGKVVWAELLVPAGSTPDQPVGAGDRPTEG